MAVVWCLDRHVSARESVVASQCKCTGLSVELDSPGYPPMLAASWTYRSVWLQAVKKSCSTDDSVVVVTYDREGVGQIGRFVYKQTNKQTDGQVTSLLESLILVIFFFSV